MLFKEDFALFKGVTIGLIVCLILLIVLRVSYARDNGQWAQADPSIKQWIESLKDKNGYSCCNTADGFDVQWDTKDGKYRVFINEEWYVVPDEAVLDIKNKIGVARVWYIPTWEFVQDPIKRKMIPKIRCFLPGAGI